MRAMTELKSWWQAEGPGSLYAMLSPMMACEEACLLGTADPRDGSAGGAGAGAGADRGEDEVFKNSITGKQTFVIKAEKVPNAAGIRRVMAMLGGNELR